jgi:hypothetical protein
MAMSKDINVHAEHDEIDGLLPWYVTGQLDAVDAARVKASLARDPDGSRRLELVREECDESILDNEAIRVRSAYHADRLLAEVARREAPLASAFVALWQRGTAALAVPSAGAIRWAAAAAVLVIAVQAGALATLIARQPSASYAPASGGGATADDGAVALVAFTADAATAAVVDLLTAHEMAIVHGPDGAGAFMVRLGAASMTDAARREKIAALRRRGDLVNLVVPLR